MKKLLLTLFFVTLSLVLVHGNAFAKVSGTCSGCHTMHNSENGDPMTYDSAAQPNQKLLKGGCIGCHGQSSSTDNIGGTTGNIPLVWHNDTTNGDLAGGNFRYGVSDPDEGKMHNVVGIAAAADTENSYNPPGFTSTTDPASTAFAETTLICAGQNGCHGNRDETDEFAAVSGAHHGDDSILHYGTDFTFTGQGATVTTSYRMLYKIKGAEDSDWNNSPTTTAHNEYYAENYAGRTGSITGWSDLKGTISDLCAECHGKFHASGVPAASDYIGIGSTSPWYRHPTDVVIPNSGEYSSISTTYSDETPVGRPSSFFTDDLASGSSTVTAGTDRVICLSCHRAHGSNYDNILRFDYMTSLAAGEGCLHCHTGKDAF